MTGRLLGVDLGARRIGLAVGDPAVGLARPLTTIRRGTTLAADIAALERVCHEQGVVELVVGLPVEASGSEGPMAVAARVWAAGVADGLGIPMTLRD